MVAVDSCLNLAHIALLGRQGWFANLGRWFRGIYLLHAVGILVDELGEIFNDAGAPSSLVSFITLGKQNSLTDCGQCWRGYKFASLNSPAYGNLTNLHFGQF